MIGIDTSALIDLFKGDKSILELLKTIEEPIFLNRLSYLELMIGIDDKQHSGLEEENYFDELFSSNYPVLELDSKSSKKARDIFQNLKKKGQITEISDCAIAGIYLVNGIKKIITKNKKHFEKIEELEVLSY